jgi:small subunit ribosomal protein S20
MPGSTICASPIMLPRPFTRRGPALANHKSALKRIRQSEKRRKRNQHVRTHMRTIVKKCRDAFETGDAAQAADAFKAAEREIRRAATKGVIPKQRADRSVGRLAKRLDALKAS